MEREERYYNIINIWPHINSKLHFLSLPLPQHTHTHTWMKYYQIKKQQTVHSQSSCHRFIIALCFFLNPWSFTLTKPIISISQNNPFIRIQHYHHTQTILGRKQTTRLCKRRLTLYRYTGQNLSMHVNTISDDFVDTHTHTSTKARDDWHTWTSSNHHPHTHTNTSLMENYYWTVTHTHRQAGIHKHILICTQLKYRRQQSLHAHSCLRACIHSHTGTTHSGSHTFTYLMIDVSLKHTR